MRLDLLVRLAPVAPAQLAPRVPRVLLLQSLARPAPVVQMARPALPGLPELRPLLLARLVLAALVRQDQQALPAQALLLLDPPAQPALLMAPPAPPEFPVLPDLREFLELTVPPDPRGLLQRWLDPPDLPETLAELVPLDRLEQQEPVQRLPVLLDLRGLTAQMDPPAQPEFPVLRGIRALSAQPA